MQVSVEAISTVERRMTIDIPSEPIKSKIKIRFKELSKETKINGFRPGKVPMRLIEQKYGQKVRGEIVNEFMNVTFREAIEQEEIVPAGEFAFNLLTDIENIEEELSYTATFEIVPKIDTLHVDGLNVERLVVKITEADIDAMLHQLRQQHQTWTEKVDDPASEEDQVIVDIFGSINDQPLKGNKVRQVALSLGRNNFILPGIEQKLLGVKKGDTRELDVTFSENHGNPELAGQIVRFVIKVIKVDVPHLPEIDAKFVELHGMADGKIETLRAEALKDMERQLEDSIKEKVKQRTLEALVTANQLEVPRCFVDAEAQRLLKERQQEWQLPNLSVDMFKEEATQRVKTGILMGKLIDMHKIQPSEEKLQQLIERIALTYEDPEATAKEIYANKQQIKEELEPIVLEDQIVVLLLKMAQVTEKCVDFYTATAGQNVMLTLGKRVTNR